MSSSIFLKSKYASKRKIPNNNSKKPELIALSYAVVAFTSLFVNVPLSLRVNPLNDAVNNNKGNIIRRITPGFNYVSISQTAYSQGKYYHYTDVGWMSGSDLALTDVPLFQGLEFTETPKQD